MYPNIPKEQAKNHISNAQLAAFCNVDAQTLERWLAGEGDIPAGAIWRMAVLLRSSADYLLHTEPGEIKKPPPKQG